MCVCVCVLSIRTITIEINDLTWIHGLLIYLNPIKFKILVISHSHMIKTVAFWVMDVFYGCTPRLDVFLVLCRLLRAKVVGAISSEGVASS